MCPSPLLSSLSMPASSLPIHIHGDSIFPWFHPSWSPNPFSTWLQENFPNAAWSCYLLNTWTDKVLIPSHFSSPVGFPFSSVHHTHCFSFSPACVSYLPSLRAFAQPCFSLCLECSSLSVELTPNYTPCLSSRTPLLTLLTGSDSPDLIWKKGALFAPCTFLLCTCHCSSFICGSGIKCVLPAATHSTVSSTRAGTLSVLLTNILDT